MVRDRLCAEALDFDPVAGAERLLARRVGHRHRLALDDAFSEGEPDEVTVGHPRMGDGALLAVDSDLEVPGTWHR